VVTSNASFRHRQTSAVDGLLAQLPADDPGRADLQRRARAYSQACGCPAGGLFLVAAILLVSTYFATTGAVGVGTVAASVFFVIVATAVGKSVGLLVAGLRLAMLRRSLSRKLQQRSLGHVVVH
jgi:hypothetical protein